MLNDLYKVGSLTWPRFSSTRISPKPKRRRWKRLCIAADRLSDKVLQQAGIVRGKRPIEVGSTSSLGFSKLPGGWSFHQRYRPLWAARDAFAALVAVVSPHNVGRHSPMGRAA
jgi:hypothetical protein